ncbi:hypothetical protein P154DRAFT_624036 [Amniculicola lignicola CBS 123094]|uniref:Chaperone DnaJ C-terminal domain-containing protein n=1 Tax=Amniculicola lignicola CBS 123094 TaxID=1392246 RepID=A0A6A5W5G0_9PLEO|nr:hypothetical protein P154DRAFT_624036 [Amniculicola lignicola CBS 123094]
MAGFGFSISDIVMVGELALSIYGSIKTAGREYRSITTEVKSVRSSLRGIQTELENPNSILNRANSTQRRELAALVTTCNSDLQDIDKELVRFRTLRKNGAPRWDKLRFTPNKQADIRTKVSRHSERLNRFLNGLQTDSLGRIEENTERHVLSFAEIRTRLDAIHQDVLNRKRDASVLTDMDGWVALEQELLGEDDVTEVDVETNKSEIVEWLEYVRGRDGFEDALKNITELEDDRSSAHNAGETPEDVERTTTLHSANVEHSHENVEPLCEASDSSNAISTFKVSGDVGPELELSPADVGVNGQVWGDDASSIEDFQSSDTPIVDKNDETGHPWSNLTATASSSPANPIGSSLQGPDGVSLEGPVSDSASEQDVENQWSFVMYTRDYTTLQDGHAPGEQLRKEESYAPNSVVELLVEVTIAPVLYLSLEDFYRGGYFQLGGTITTYDPLTRTQWTSPETSRYIRLKEGEKAGSCHCVDVEFGIMVEVAQKPHRRFRREGDDLHYTFDLDLYDALCGWALTIEGIDGESLNVESGSTPTPQWTQTLIGKGMPKEEDPDKRGDLILTANIKFPTTIAAKDKHKLRDVLRPEERHQECWDEPVMLFDVADEGFGPLHLFYLGQDN